VNQDVQAPPECLSAYEVLIMKILVVEDEAPVAQAIELLLTSHHYAVDRAADGLEGLAMATAYHYDLMLLDVGLPGMDGVSLCQQLRTRGIQSPILLLTGLDVQAHAKAVALNAGADDYVTKPFDVEELLARIQTLLRRGDLQALPILRWGSVSLDPIGLQVSYGATLLHLTPKEYRLLEILLRHAPNIVSVRAILEQGWSALETPGDETVRTHMKELRKKLKAAGAPEDLIKTMHRQGYRLNPLYGEVTTSAQGEAAATLQMAELKAVNEELRHTLQEQRSQWQALFDHALEAIFIADDEGHYLDANPAACQLLGMARDDLLQCSIADFADPDINVAEVWRQSLKQGQMSGELRLYCPNGQIKDTEFNAISHFVPGRHLSILREITGRKRVE
jgi:PAS domain S-box-containing protein